MEYFKEHLRLFVSAAALAGCTIAVYAFGMVGNSVPESAAHARQFFSPGDIAASRSYFLWGAVPALLAKLLSIACLAFLAYRHRTIAAFFDKNIHSSCARLIAIALVTLVSQHIIAFPFAIVSGYVRKKMFAILSSGFSLWLYRYAVTAVISLAISTCVVVLFVWIVRRYESYRLMLPIAFLVLSLAGILFYPRFVLPLTHEVRLLDNEALKGKIEQMLKRAQMPVQAIYVIQESRYTKSVNAFFTGWGRWREIYLYDSLTQHFSDEEALAVIAHELCHYREEHVLIGVLLGGLGILLGIIALELLSQVLLQQTLASAVREIKIPHLLLMFMLLSFFAQPARNAISRTMEQRCDAYALYLTGDKNVCAEMERKIARANRSDLLPHPVYHFWFGTHPTAVERIEYALYDK